MQSLEVSGAVRPIYGSLGVRRLMKQKSNSMVRVIRMKPITGELLIISTSL